MTRQSNPYVVGPPLRTRKSFFGRQDILEWVTPELQNPSTNALVLYGQRRIGKTSLLLQLQHALPSDKFFSVYFDPHDTARLPLGRVLAKLAKKAARKAKLKAPRSADFDDQGQFFLHDFLPLLDQSIGGDRRLVFLLDEFDVFDGTVDAPRQETAAAETLFPLLRDVMDADVQPAFVFVVGRNASDLSLNYEATFRTSLARQVWVLDREGAEALVRQAELNGTLRFTEGAVQRILELTNGHPYLTQLLCHLLWEHSHSGEGDESPEVDAPDVDTVVADVLEAGQDAFLWFWDGLSPLEKVYVAAMASVADEEGQVVSEDRVMRVLDGHAARLRAPGISEAPHNLVKRRVLEQVDEGQYRFVIDILRRWLRKGKPLREIGDELDRVEPQAEQWFEVGRKAFHQEQWEEGVKYFRGALDTNPRHLRARLYLGQALLELGQAGEAVQELDRAYELDREEARQPLVRALLTQAATLQEAGDDDGALALCERALYISPNEERAQDMRSAIWIRRGSAAMEQGTLDEALMAYRRAGAAGWEDAVDMVRRALRRDPGLWRTRLYLGRVLLDLGKAEEAVGQLEQAYELNPDQAWPMLTRALIALAKAHREAGEEEEALAACERALEISPEQPEAKEILETIWIQRGNAAMERGAPYTALLAYQRAGATGWEEAIPLIRSALEADAGLLGTRLHLAQVLLELDRPEEAVAELEQAYELKPEESRAPLTRALVVLARARREAGEEEGALQACDRAIELSPQDREANQLRTAIWIRRGDAALEQGSLDVAQAAYERAGDEAQVAEVKRLRRQREYETLERQAVASEQAKQWRRAAEAYNQLLEETENAQLRERWQVALQRVQVELSQAEPGGWAPGFVLDGRYKIAKRLAVTSRSEVYLAEEQQPPYHTLVVKRLKPERMEDEEMCKRFEREIVALRQIRHQSVLFIYDSKTVGPDRYFVAEYADKGTLREYLLARPDRKLRPIEALEIALSVCQGLEAAHRQGIIHRDVKPGNVFLCMQRDESIVAKIADFSIARIPTELQNEDLTQFGVFMGTLPYASLEQIKGEVADPRSDLYSWAIVFFEMLTGEFPTDSLKDPLTFHPTADEYPTSFFTTRGVPPQLVEVLQKNLCQDRALRSQSVAEVREALEGLRAQIVGDIELHLDAGEEFIRNFDWQAAHDEFWEGLELCAWYGRPDKLHGKVGELANRLKMGHLCALGMLHLARHEWQAATETLEPLRTLDPHYLDVDVAAKLRIAQAELRFEQKYQLLLQYQELESWADILRLATDFTTTYLHRPESEIIGNIQKLALYAQAKQLLEQDDLEGAYQRFYRLYERDPDYQDVADLAAGVAYQISTQEDVPVARDHQVRWLEKVVEIDPQHREGRTQQQLDRLRRSWAEELLENDRVAAIAQLERISSEYNQRTEVYRSLVNSYYQLLRDGDYVRTAGTNISAEAEARYRLGMEQLGRGDLESAVEQLTTIFPEANEFASAQSVLAQIYVTLGRRANADEDWEKAAKWWDEALAVSRELDEPQSGEAYQALVNDYYQLLRSEKYTRTEWSHLEAEAEARYRLGMEYWGKGDLEAAVEQLMAIPPQAKETGSVPTDLIQVYITLGQRMDAQGDWQSAAGWWDKALAAAANLSAVQWYDVSQALVNDYYQLLRANKYVRTEWSYLDAEAEARYRLGSERWRQGDLQGAVEQLTAIHLEAKEYRRVQQDLIQIYDALGNRAFKRLRFFEAIRQWSRGNEVLSHTRGAQG